MTTSQDMDEIDLFGKKLPKKAQLLSKYILLNERFQKLRNLFKCFEMELETLT